MKLFMPLLLVNCLSRKKSSNKLNKYYSSYTKKYFALC